jgi:hypothetical protein
VPYITYVTNLGFQRKILRKQQNYLIVVVSFATHNVYRESQGTFLMVDQWPNTGVKFFPPVMKIVHFQSEMLYPGMHTVYTLKWVTAGSSHISL